MITERTYIPPLSAILLNGYSFRTPHKDVLETLNLHNMARNYAWPAVFRALNRKPELVNTICETLDSTLMTIAAEQGDLGILDKLLKYGADINQTTYTGLTVLDAAKRIDDLITMIKATTWIKGNLDVKFNYTPYLHPSKSQVFASNTNFNL